MNMTTSEIYGESYQALKSNPLMLLPLALSFLAYFGLMLMAGFGMSNISSSTMSSDAMSGTAPTVDTANLGMLTVVAVLGLIIEFAGYCWIQVMAAEVILEGGTSLGSSFSNMISRLPSFFVVALILSVVMVAVMVVGVVALAPLGLIGVLLLLIVTLFMTLFMALAFPAVAMAGLGPIDAIVDSFRKVKSNLGRMVVFAILTFVLAIGVGIVSGILAAFIPRVGMLLYLFISVAFATLVLVALTRLYAEIAWKEYREYAAWQDRITGHLV